MDLDKKLAFEFAECLLMLRQETKNTAGSEKIAGTMNLPPEGLRDHRMANAQRLEEAKRLSLLAAERLEQLINRVYTSVKIVDITQASDEAPTHQVQFTVHTEEMAASLLEGTMASSRVSVGLPAETEEAPCD